MKQSFIVQVSADDGLLHVQCSGVVRLEDFPPLFDEIRQLADKHQLRSILIDARAFKGRLSAVQRLQVAQALVAKFLGYKVAGVISPESFDPRLLAETMARNRGVNVKMCTRLSEALKWLGPRKAEMPSPPPRLPGPRRQAV